MKSQEACVFSPRNRIIGEFMFLASSPVGHAAPGIFSLICLKFGITESSLCKWLPGLSFLLFTVAYWRHQHILSSSYISSLRRLYSKAHWSYTSCLYNKRSVYVCLQMKTLLFFWGNGLLEMELLVCGTLWPSSRSATDLSSLVAVRVWLWCVVWASFLLYLGFVGLPALRTSIFLHSAMSYVLSLPFLKLSIIPCPFAFVDDAGAFLLGTEHSLQFCVNCLSWVLSAQC